ncbi:MAG: DUF523 domain-containing protein, partial [Actinobacteria bacterium]|nr:DUF523 domain-containing protein [Actinomycetota bacterium]
ACMAGIPCHYDGSAGDEYPGARRGVVVAVCPEQLGGLATPRSRAEIVGGTGDDVLDGRARVMSEQGDDVTEEYLRGAYATLEVARAAGATTAVLQDKSPSCGSTVINDGSFSKTRRTGMGVTAALLARHGIAVRPT